MARVYSGFSSYKPFVGGYQAVAGRPKFLPLRSGMLRMPSRANSSKQPICSPAMILIGAPASIGQTASLQRRGVLGAVRRAAVTVLLDVCLNSSRLEPHPRLSGPSITSWRTRCASSCECLL
jgi:hypothetical protein